MTRRRTFLAAAVSGFATSLAGCGLLADGTDGDPTTDAVNGTTTADEGDETTTEDRDDATTSEREFQVDGSFRQYQYDASNTGLVPEASGPSGGSSTLFEFGGAGVQSGHNLGSPAVVDGTLFVMEGSQSEDGTARSVVYALDATDGSVTWEQPYEGGNVVGPVAVAEDVVLASFGGHLKALERSTGEERWSVSKDLDSRPAVARGSAYVIGSGMGPTFAYSLRSRTGPCSGRRRSTRSSI